MSFELQAQYIMMTADDLANVELLNFGRENM